MMETLAVIAFYVGVVAYSAAATLSFVELARPAGAPEGPRWAARALGIGVAAQAFPFAAALGEGAGALSLRFGLMLCAGSLAITFLVLRARMRIDAIGVVVAPLSLALLVGAQFLTARGPSAGI